MAFYADHPTHARWIEKLKGEGEGGKPDMFVRVASEMALVHNMAIRGLNSIYLQAPHVPAAESRAFLRYVLAWHDLLHVHHSGEEADLFPAIEAMAGQAGLMDGNVSQHEEFRDGLAAFKAYVDACASGREQLDGARLVALIDGFGGPLARHLGDEIPSILGLRLFGADKMAGLEQKFAEEGEKNMKSLGLVKGLPFCLSNHDVAFEGDRWAAWPPAPSVVKLLCRYGTYWIHRESWKYAACDRMGNLKPLYAVPGKAESK